ncbi:MAG: tetratricopeptide repeat protein [Acidimicrobiia bacterium]
MSNGRRQKSYRRQTSGVTMRNPERLRWEAQRDQAAGDIEDLEVQLASGELDHATVVRLRATYRAELREAEEELARLSAQPAGPPEQGRSSRRMLVGGLLLAVSFGGIAALAGRFVEPRDPGVSGLASEIVDLESVSDEQMEAVIAANLDDPLINGMRLALADRYFEERRYRQAFDHYLSVLENEPSSPEEATALSRVGWMAYDGNGEVELARSYLEKALTIQPGFSEATYLLGLVALCGEHDPQVAIPLFEQVLEDPEMPAPARPDVEEALATARSGGSCR